MWKTLLTPAYACLWAHHCRAKKTLFAVSCWCLLCLLCLLPDGLLHVLSLTEVLKHDSFQAA